MNIACTIDSRYIRHCAVMLRSLRLANPHTVVNVWIVHNGLDTVQASKFIRYVSSFTDTLSLIQLDESIFSGFPITHHISIATYFRLFIGDILPYSAKRVIFLDSDITIHDDLSELWETSLQGFPIGCVELQNSEVDRERLQLTDEQKYFNAGVLLVDLEHWRRCDVLQAGKRFLEQHPERILWWDQDVLNHLFRGNWHALDWRWNAVPQWFTDELSNSAIGTQMHKRGAVPAIVHFAGGGASKPWHFHCQHPLRHLYREIQKETPWASTPLDATPSIAQRLKGLARAYVG